MPTTTGVATEFIQFTRASNATVTDSDGKVKWAPHNLLLASESFDAAAWGTTGGVTVTANSTNAPNSTTTADTLAFTTTGYHYQLVAIGSPVIGTTYTGGVWLWSTTGKTQIALRLSGVTIGADQTVQIVTLTSTPTLFTVSRTFTGGDTSIGLGIDNRTSVGADGVAGSVIAWGASLYRSDLAMQPNTSAYPLYNPTTPKNLLGYTEAFSDAYWTKFRSSAPAATNITAPNGLQTADKLVPQNGLTSGGVYSFTSIVSGGVYTASVYAKAAELGFVFVGLNIRASSVSQGLCVNLATGARSNEGGSGTYTVTDAGNGWWRISCSGSSTTTNGYLEIWPLAAAGTYNSYTGDGTSGIYLWGAQLSDSASLDSYVPIYGAAVTSAAYYGPRRDFDGATLACKGLLVEELRVNLVLYSEAFDNGYWSRNASATVAADTVVSPSGTQTADTITGSGSAYSGVVRNVASTNGLTYTSSVYVKSGTSPFIAVLFDAGNSAAWFDITTGAKGSSGGATAYDIIPVGNGWYRVWITFVASGGANATLWVAPVSANSATTGTGTIYLWGAQVEAASFATSYIPTGAATATRNADVASVSTQAFPYSATEGTVVVNYDRVGITQYSRLFTLSDAGQNQISVLNFNAGQENPYFVQSGAGTTVTGPSLPAVNAVAKMGFAFKTGDSAYSLNGATATANATSFTVSATTLSLGYVPSSGQYLNGHIRQITYLPRRLSNADLQARTA